MIRGDRIFGAVMILVALAYIAGALQLRTSFLSDPVGSKTFPIVIGVITVLCGAVMIARPDDEPDWPGLRTLGALLIATAALIGYAYALKPLGFVGPTAVVAALLSYQISPRPLYAVVTGVALSLGLFVMFHYGLNLTNIKALPSG